MSGQEEQVIQELSRSDSVLGSYMKAFTVCSMQRRELDSLEKSLSEGRIEIEQLGKELEVGGKGLEIFKKLIDHLTERSLGTIEKLVSGGLRVIFDDRDLSFKIVVGNRGSAKTCQFLMIEDGIEREIESCGAGLSSVVSMLLRIYFIKELKRPKFLILDESMTRIATAYVDNFFSFLKEVIRAFGLDVLFITHDVRFVDYGDDVYEVQKGGGVELITASKAKSVIKNKEESDAV